ncbi:pancreatic trypsin inhibitor-like [Hippopotamus amphibius kiboko]|uniref:pancreatic trypsin inhibitor-like n=1 Tax=Hippopotamus amphibius kiboko TaxID=575201 RepID=UPI002598D606|nr:pancreatic trypsin inhibitor-like [Hippopotamus amphibius kiboko]
MSRLCLSFTLLVLLVTLVSCSPGGKKSKHAQVTSQPDFHLEPENTGRHLTRKFRYYCNTNTGKCVVFTYGGKRGRGKRNHFLTEEDCLKACHGQVGTTREPGHRTPPKV